jgi:hypothetical protein
MKKTKFCSYCVKGISSGCKQCVRGEKLVLFISGICSRNCWYCSLSNKRKNSNKMWVNERECKTIKEIIKEVKESNSRGAGITGGDPLLFLNKTIKIASALKKEFGKNFHIHIYLPTKLVTKQNLKKLSKVIDEVRFHPEVLLKKLSKKKLNSEIEKIKFAGLFFDKKNIGLEMPCIPNMKKEIIDFITKTKEYIGFVNLNEFEVSETNLKKIIKKYKLNSTGYVISESKKAGLDILKKIEKLNIRVHLCTADLKNWHQYKNRLKLHKILKYGYKTENGTVIYLITNLKNLKKVDSIGKKYLIDKSKKRVILSEALARELIKKSLIVERVEEFPTYDRIEVEKEQLN